MSSVLQVTDDTFDELVLQAPGVVLVDLWAPWCGPCRQMEPVIEELSRELTGVTVAKLNTDDNPGATASLQITSIPTLLIYSRGELVKTLVGARPKAAIRDALQEYAAV
ncbi:thioredoxin [Serinibacter salmoneus]|uniref:Thioredoxin n=1 Tax=Serinibacter salmoneus TaxID=556530 RepID=A0A2A9D4I4_9MICO|nr:thioredoxin [Serinibacter salmoneus]PFG21165.1 thioredoxin [Serinibacter salmoneus]